MKKILALLAGSVAFAALSLPANAATMNVFLSQDNGALTQTTIGAPGQSTFTNANQPFGAFLISNITGSTVPTTVAPVQLSSNTLDIQNVGLNTPHTLDIYITASDLTSPLGLVNMFSGFTNTTLSDGWAVTLSTLLSATNQLFAGNLIATTTYTGGPTPTTFSTNFSNLVNDGLGPLFSLTGHYHIVTDGTGQANSGISIEQVSAVPIPAVGTGLPGIIGAVGGLIYYMKKRRADKLARSQASLLAA